MSFKVWIHIEDYDESRDPESIEIDPGFACVAEYDQLELAQGLAILMQTFGTKYTSDDPDVPAMLQAIYDVNRLARATEGAPA